MLWILICCFMLSLSRLKSKGKQEYNDEIHNHLYLLTYLECLWIGLSRRNTLYASMVWKTNNLWCSCKTPFSWKHVRKSWPSDGKSAALKTLPVSSALTIFLLILKFWWDLFCTGKWWLSAQSLNNVDLAYD